ncbi:MAG: XRE family transcriptional regulator [Alphaproteobacteria bacterium]|nr:MAG: XRE family transcriptional regulator [Alphaproteobacteria bacterium]
MSVLEPSLIQPSAAPFGGELRYWRRLRGLSQMELANKAATTPRHVSFMETGRSRPSGQMVLRLVEALDVPPADRNDMLVAAGFEPIYESPGMEDHDRAAYERVFRQMLQAHEPYPALLLNRWYDVIVKNDAAQRFLAGGASNEPTNIIDVIFARDTFRGMVRNWTHCAWTILHELRREVIAVPRDKRLHRLLLVAESAMADIQPPVWGREDEMEHHAIYLVEGEAVHTVVTMTKAYNFDPSCPDQLRVMSMFPRDDAAERFFRKLAE